MYIQTIMYLLEKWFGIAMGVGIIITYFYSSYVLVRFIRMVGKQRYTWLLILILVIAIGFVASYSYIILKLLSGEPVYITSYGLLYIRPLNFLMGCAIACFTTISLKTYEQGGTKWIRFKSEK